MGAWGEGSFENDHAGDWLWSLAESEDDTLLRATLERVAELPAAEYLEAPACCEAIAAAEIVAALLGRPPAELSDEARAWVSAHAGLATRELAALSRRALARIRASSELRELWEESGADGWYTSLDDLERRLNA